MLVDNLLSVDPGIRHSGVAYFRDGKLEWAGLVVNTEKTGNGAKACSRMAWAIDLAAQNRPGVVSALAVEFPRIYATRIRQGTTREDPNDLLALAGVVSALAAVIYCDDVTSYAPSDWKGQLDKGAGNARVLARLSDEERTKIVEAGARTHNIIDAIGIGLHHLGRLDRKRVFPRE